jgi:hypothetical protein
MEYVEHKRLRGGGLQTHLQLLRVYSAEQGAGSLQSQAGRDRQPGNIDLPLLQDYHQPRHPPPDHVGCLLPLLPHHQHRGRQHGVAGRVSQRHSLLPLHLPRLQAALRLRTKDHSLRRRGVDRNGDASAVGRSLPWAEVLPERTGGEDHDLKQVSRIVLFSDGERPHRTHASRSPEAAEAVREEAEGGRRGNLGGGDRGRQVLLRTAFLPQRGGADLTRAREGAKD